MNKHNKSLKNDPGTIFHDFTVKQCSVHGIMNNKFKECSECLKLPQLQKKGNI